MSVQLKEISIAHSPDSDDAFMFYAIANNLLDAPGLTIKQVMKDIQTLNQIASTGEYEVSAISFAVYPHIAELYALMPCGSSMGDKYGPVVVARKYLSRKELKTARIAVPGRQTTAWLVLQLFEQNLNPVFMPFDEILSAVAEGRVDAGLLIHEGQLTYRSLGLRKVIDLGLWWHEMTGLPLPLGGSVVRKDLGPKLMGDITRIFKASIVYSLEHRQAALDYAMSYARDMGVDVTDKYVAMYVNDLSVDFGDVGRKALNSLFTMGYERGLYRTPVNIEFVES